MSDLLSKIDKCANPPSRGGIPMDELKKLALSMGIETGNKNKEEICAEIKAKVSQQPDNQVKVTQFKIKKILTTAEKEPETDRPITKIVIKKITPSSSVVSEATVKTPVPAKTATIVAGPGPAKVATDKASATCIAVDKLRKSGYQDLDAWMQDSNNLYVGRHGRIFITDPVTKEKRIFHYPASKWANPYKVAKKSPPSKGEYTLEDSIALYKKHLQDSGLLADIHELRGKRLGCFCDQSEVCHAQILADLANQ